MAVVVVVAAFEGVAVLYFGTAPSRVVVPPGSYPTSGPLNGGHWVSFRYENNRTAAYSVTGYWEGSGPVQVIIAAEWGLNWAGCGFIPLNYRPGPFPEGCWPNFTATNPRLFMFTFHICVVPERIPTGSFLVIFRSLAPASVIVTRPFEVQESGFPQSSC
jgi:hypothetical protein